MPVVERVNPYSRYFYVPDPEGSGAPPPSTQDLRDIFGPEAEQVQEELGRLLREYRSTILYGQRHYAASPSWREENVLLPGKGAYVSSRFAIRVHLFEAASNVLEKSQLGIEHAGRYLGFVTLRPPGSEIVLAEQGTATKGFRYVVEAELVPPRQMLRPRYHVLTTTVGAARLGVLPIDVNLP